MSRTIDQQIAEATNKIQRLKSKKKARDTRLKIVVGATMIAEARADPQMAALMVKALQTRVTREVDLKEIASLMEDLTKHAQLQPTRES
jgi:hypothetical protein